MGSKDSTPRKWRLKEEMQIYVNEEISINYACIGEIWDHTKMSITNLFSFAVVTKILSDDDLESHTIDECRRRHDWPKWQEAI